MVALAGLKMKDTGIKHVAIATSQFGVFLEVKIRLPGFISYRVKHFYTPGLYCSSVKLLPVLERTLTQHLSSNFP